MMYNNIILNILKKSDCKNVEMLYVIMCMYIFLFHCDDIIL